MTEAADPARLRLDKWLWHVRLQPTRSKAAQCVRDGYIRINSVRCLDPAKLLRIGDVLTVALHNRTFVVRVLALPQRRGPASHVPEWYTLLDQA